MSSRLVDDRWVPDPVSGHPALELCNTRAGWGAPAPKEYLVDYPALRIWARENGLVRADCEGDAGSRTAAAILARTKRLRGALYAALVDRDDGALEQVHRAVGVAMSRSEYVAADDAVALHAGPGLSEPLDAAALAAHELLLDFGPGAVGRCGGAGCGWLFLDPSGRRRWCIMAVCGNRAKARRHAARHHEPTQSTASIPPSA